MKGYNIHIHTIIYHNECNNILYYIPLSYIKILYIYNKKLHLVVRLKVTIAKSTSVDDFPAELVDRSFV